MAGLLPVGFQTEAVIECQDACFYQREPEVGMSSSEPPPHLDLHWRTSTDLADWNEMATLRRPDWGSCEHH